MSKLSAMAEFFEADADHPLNASRLTKLLYLADWRSVLTGGRPISDIDWVLMPFGPDPDVLPTDIDGGGADDLSGHDRDILDFVQRTAGTLPWSNLDELVRSTPPVLMARHRPGVKFRAIIAGRKVQQPATL